MSYVVYRLAYRLISEESYGETRLARLDPWETNSCGFSKSYETLDSLSIMVNVALADEHDRLAESMKRG